MKKTLVLGASPKPERYSNRAVLALQSRGFEAVPLGNRAGQIGDTTILTGMPELEDIHTVTMYLGAARQHDYYDYIFSLKPERIIFNPGAENPELQQLANQQGIETLNACNLVMLSVGNF